MKKIYLLLLSIAFVVSCNQNTLDQIPVKPPTTPKSRITIEQAEQNLTNILNSFNSECTRGGEDNLFANKKIAHKYIRGSLATTRTTKENEPIYYIFNFEDNGGFAVMAGDSRMPEMLVLTHEGSLKEGEDFSNPNSQEMFASIDNMYSKTISNVTIRTEEDSVISLYKYTSEIFPMINDGCQVKWGQGIPSATISILDTTYLYNSQCPKIGEYFCYAGCAAVALAQLMSIHKVDYEGKFDWYEMTKYPKITYYTPINYDFELTTLMDTKSDIAYLMKTLGNPENLSMSYGLNGSSAYTQKYAMRTFENFGYSNGGYYIENDSIIFDELKSGYPIIMRGKASLNSSSGHAWLGHKGMTVTKTLLLGSKYITHNNYVLCNFGWDGKDDGYYLLGCYTSDKKYTGEDFATEPEYVYYPADLGAVINIRP